MDGPKKAIALWKTQYSVRISSNPVEVFPSSTSWFDAGAVAELTAPEGTTGIDTRQMFDGWAGDYVGNSTRASIQMDGPKSLVATYKTQYLLSIVILPPDVAQMVGLANRTWCDAQTTAKLGPIPGTVSLSPVEQLISPTWNVDGMIQQGTSVEVFMNRPHHVEVTYRRQYYLEVKSRLGQPTGSGWKDSGETATFGVTYSESDFPVKHTLTGWQSSPQTTITTVGQTTAEVRMDRPYVVEAVWYDDYTPMWLFVLALGAGVAIIVGLVVVHVKRPQYLKSLATSFRSGLKRRKIRSPSVGVGTAVSSVVCHKCGARIPATASF
jgi:hypothetical protein